MDTISNLLAGFNIALQPINFFYCFVGVFLGTLVGVLPGIGSLGGVALLLPFTYGLDVTSAIILLAGIYYGTQYGGSTTSILMNVPGELSTMITCLDGHQMALKGRAGPALGIAAFGSFIAGTSGTIGLMLIANPVSRVAIKFGPAEFSSLVILSIVLLSFISRGSVVRGLMMAAIGYSLSFVGIDPIEGRERFTFDLTHLTSGLDLGALGIGLFGVSEVLLAMEKSVKMTILDVGTRVGSYFPSLKDWRDSVGSIFRGSIIGFLVGVIPGGGALLASFASYAIEKRVSKYPEKFGTGMIEGLAGPESANNSATSGAFVPLLTIGIPSNVVTALLLGALMIHGVQPGPFFLSQHADMFWGIVASMYVGNAMLLVLNLPLIPLWVQVLKIPERVLLPLILLFCIVGSYGVNNNILDVLVVAISGGAGYVLRKAGYEIAPLCVAFVLGPILESSFRQSLIISRGSFMTFVTRPISALLLCASALLLLYSVISRKKVVAVDLDT